MGSDQRVQDSATLPAKCLLVEREIQHVQGREAAKLDAGPAVEAERAMRRKNLAENVLE